MRCILQRVSRAQVEVEGAVIGKIGKGLMVLVCAMQDDGEENAQRMAKKIASLRIFPDAAGKMNLSLTDAGGGVLAISQFTLAADTSRGNRPGFSAAAPPDLGEALYEKFCVYLREQGIEVATGRFGAEMDVSLTNAGPVTISLET